MRHSINRLNRFRTLLLACSLLLGGGALGQDIQLDATLDTTLDKTGRLVLQFLDELSDVKCTEHVLQQKLTKSGHVEISEQSTYDYLVMLQGDKDDFLLNESRIEEKTVTAPQKHLPLLLTNGFSSLYLIFHPYYRSSFRISAVGLETLDRQPLLRLHFTHLPGTRTPAALSVRGREYPLELNGTAWIVPLTGAIVRIQTGLQSDMKDVGLRSLTADVEYTPVLLSGMKRTYLFPSVATIDVQSLRQHWRNIHRFEAYMKFSVDAEQVPNSIAKSEKVRPQ